MKRYEFYDETGVIPNFILDIDAEDDKVKSLKESFIEMNGRDKFNDISFYKFLKDNNYDVDMVLYPECIISY